MKIEEIYEKFLQCDGVVIDSRKNVNKQFFICLKGENFNANAFANEVLDKGAAWVLMDDISYYQEIHDKNRVILVDDSLKAMQQLAALHRKKLNVPVVAIGGSNGKTTTKELIKSVLSQQYEVFATPGNFNNHIGVPLSILSIRSDVKLAILELGANHVGEIEFLCEIADPDFGLITNIGKEHLEGFGSFENVIKAETELYNHIKSKDGIIFLNQDDSILVNAAEGMKKISYSSSNQDAYVFGELITNNQSPFLKIKWKSKANQIHDQIIETKLFGEYNLHNILAAITVGLYFKISHLNINKAISEYSPDNQRSQWVTTPKNNRLVIDCYNANPTSMQAAIRSFAGLNMPDKIYILGDMLELGDFAEEEHEKILETLDNIQEKKTVWLVGNEFFKFKKKFPRYEFFKKTEELIEKIGNIELQDKTIILKASRGIQLEKLIPLL
ncbi:MAG: UDP-N-acetylmuramoyl-tripeptide--D-alanyl-D-alanine ligase [Bacteroidia bacterium]|nr:MAG: UDP-N-acetylmuramoyl-tripeptide--D-alanyl-D-alanine ligase [Bacteroidia bacterium]